MDSKTHLTPIVGTDAPEGYRLATKPSNFNALCGPYYKKVVDGLVTGIALRIADKHLNELDITHGGVLMTLADNAMGDALESAYGYKTSLVTVSMNSDFLKPGVAGDWVEARPVVHRKGQRMAFAECLLYISGTLVFKASGVFAVVGQRDI